MRGIPIAFFFYRILHCILDIEHVQKLCGVCYARIYEYDEEAWQLVTGVVSKR
jgi:hypothetical protein